MPGALLGGRYRIAGLIGRGGMGEVYRADDLKLGQPVALKFLSEGIETGHANLHRFLAEIRIARQVSHPNVCRVYDVEEFEGQHFLAMEFVDGEDLASLLRRIGRLPPEKATQFAQQICAGLAAAHDAGVLHRDLKPSNILIDGRGRPKISDFGLAAHADEIRGQRTREGTPAYMAPEQHAGESVTVRSDIYALGLVLYEMFTGRPAFRAGTAGELLRMQRETTPTSPSGLVAGLDPAVERAIARCLDPEPSRRPGSALAVAAALPGGDPLAAALAAGETPSPEMVAAAGGEGSLRPGVALACVAFAIAAIGAALFLADKGSIQRIAPLERPPSALVERARDVVESVGYDTDPRDRAFGFVMDDPYKRYLIAAESLDLRSEIARGNPSVLRFWYRQSPRELFPSNSSSVVNFNDPPIRISGMVNLYLDSRGRLLELHAVPPQIEDSSATASDADWEGVFRLAGLELASFAPIEPTWVPLTYADQRRAWEGVYRNEPEVRAIVHAASFQGRPTYFQVIFKWTRPGRDEPYARLPSERILAGIAIAISLAWLTGAILLALRHLRLGRGDLRGGLRVGVAVLILGTISFLLSAHHSSGQAEVAVLLNAFHHGLWAGVISLMLYLAIEPFIRRRWPDALISWNRLLTGQLKDPRLGRDVVIGCAFGAGTVLLSWCDASLPLLSRSRDAWPQASSPTALLGGWHAMALLIDSLVLALVVVMIATLVFVLLRILLRRDRLVVAVGVVLSLIMDYLDDEAGRPRGLLAQSLSIVLGVLVASGALVCLIRFGLVATIVLAYVAVVLRTFPVTLDFSAWYARSTLLPLISLLILLAYGFRTSLGGRPLIRDDFLGD